MQRTQISLTAAERQLLDALSTRTGRSLSALIREAIEIAYGAARSTDDDLAAMCQAKGCWTERDIDSADWVETLRSGSRLAP